MEKRVAIVGAGISGLLACKYVASNGLDPIVFEEQPQVGGVWSNTIQSTRLQNFKEYYQFSDFPWPDSVTDPLPHNKDVLEYIQSYAHHFDLLHFIHFNSKVVSIDFVGVSEHEMSEWELWGGCGRAFGSKGNWVLKVLDLKHDSIKEYVVEFLVLCIGRYSGLPFIPEFPPGYGPEDFSGKVVHSMDYSVMDNAVAAEFIKGKRVVVIGSSKSALDIATECATINGHDQPCTLIQRTIHWMFPDEGPWGIHYHYLFFSRFWELMVHKPGEGLFSSALATLLSPLRWVLSKFVESYVRYKCPLKKYGMIPKHSVVQEVASCEIIVMPEKLYERADEGSLVLKKSENFSFCKEGVMIEGEERVVKADIVILATGYNGAAKLKNIFASLTFQKEICGSALFRQMIHPRIPQLAMIGYAESISNLYTYEMLCKWLAFFVGQAFCLPSIKEMEDDIKTLDVYMKRYTRDGVFKRSCIAGIHIWYNDQLCKDIGCNPRRKKGFFSDLFEPYGFNDYKGIGPSKFD